MKRARHLHVVPDAADETDGSGDAYWGSGDAYWAWAGLPEMEPPEEPPEEEEIDADPGDGKH